MRRTLPVLLCGTALLLNTHHLAAQSGGQAQGTITNAEGTALSGATVMVKGTKRGAITDSKGSFTIENLPEGRHTLVISYVGMAPQQQEITVRNGGTSRVDFVLKEKLSSSNMLVTVQRPSVNEKPIGIGKTNIPTRDLPQSVAIVEQETLEEQQTLHVGDALKNVNGIYVMGNTGGTQEEIAGRGFAFGSTSTFKNGVRYNNGIMPEMSSLERVEVLKGSSAILFGNVSAGGVINIVTRKPQFEQGGEMSMRVGSYGFYKPSIDVYGSVLGSQHVAYRVDASYEKAKSFRDTVNSERVYINPSLLTLFNDQTSLLVEGDYLNDRRTLDYGTGAINYSIAEVPRTRFLGTSWGYNRVEQLGTTLTATHRFDSTLELRAVGGYQQYQSDLFGTTRPNSGQLVKADGTWIRGLQRTQVDENYTLGQLDLNARLSTGPVDHRILVGADVDRYDTRTTAYEGITAYDTVNILTFDAATQRGDIPVLKQRTLTTAPVNRAGIYAQDLVAVADWLKVLAGVRWSYQDTRSEVLTYATNATTNTANYDDAVTPRFGIVYQPTENISLFTSYSNSFTLNTGVDINGNALPPSFINQYEAGVKTDWFDNLLSTNVVAYQIVNSALAQTSLENGNTNSNIKELAGEVTSKGLEVDITTTRWNGFSVIAGYAYNQTTYTKSNIYIVGSLLRYNPAHTANLALSYASPEDGPLPGASFGVSATYIGDRMAGRSTRLTVQNDVYRLMPIPAFTQVDLSAGYDFNGLSFRLKLSNVFDVLSYYIHDDNSINPIAPRMLSLTTRVRL